MHGSSSSHCPPPPGDQPPRETILINSHISMAGYFQNGNDQITKVSKFSYFHDWRLQHGNYENFHISMHGSSSSHGPHPPSDQPPRETCKSTILGVTSLRGLCP